MMKINCDKITLNEAISNVMKAVSSRSTMPILEGILLRANNGRLSLVGYDLELGITTEIEANVQEPGEVVLSASYLYNIIRKMPGDRIVIECDDKLRTTIESGVTTFNILGLPPAEYPEIPIVSAEQSFTMKRSMLKNMIDMTLFAVSTADTRPVQTGSLFDISHREIKMVSVDGFRLALRKEPIDILAEKSFRFVVPGKTLSEVSKLIDYNKKEEESKVSICFSGKHAIFDIDDYTIFTRLLEGEFLEYQNSIPEGSSTTVVADKRTLIDCIERTSLLITERLKSPLRCELADGIFKISCATTVGRSYDEMGCSMEGAPVEIGFNNRYLLDALKAADNDQVKLEISGALSPMKVIPIEGEHFLFLVLPMRLNRNEA